MQPSGRGELAATQWHDGPVVRTARPHAEPREHAALGSLESGLRSDGWVRGGDASAELLIQRTKAFYETSAAAFADPKLSLATAASRFMAVAIWA